MASVFAFGSGVPAACLEVHDMMMGKRRFDCSQGPEGLGQRTQAEVVRYLLNPTAGALLRLLGVRVAKVVAMFLMFHSSEFHECVEDVVNPFMALEGAAAAACLSLLVVFRRTWTHRRGWSDSW